MYVYVSRVEGRQGRRTRRRLLLLLVLVSGVAASARATDAADVTVTRFFYIRRARIPSNFRPKIAGNRMERDRNERNKLNN